MKKVQSPLIISQATRLRIEALAAVRTETRAEVTRIALEGGGLRALERQHRDELDELGRVAGFLGLGKADLAAQMLAEGMSLRVVQERYEYPERAA